MYLLLCICCLASGLLVNSSALKVPYYDLDQAEQLFEDFILTHGKIYPNEREKQMRLEIFKDNLKTINEKNAIGGAVFVANHLTDLSKEEFRQQFLGFDPYFGEHNCKDITIEDVNTDVPASVNWVEKGAVTPIKSQAHCGSCWAFATTGNLEGQYFIKEKKLLSFSEQLLVDCSNNTNGCNGGNMLTAMTDLMDIGGVELESTYPYVAKQESCKFDKSKVITNITGCSVYHPANEEQLKTILAKNGPLIVGVNGYDIQTYYTQGILHKDHCSDIIPKNGNHAVLLVGYGTENGIDYWLIKNSWTTTFGENGYLRITRGENTCGIMGFISSAVM